MCGSDGAAKEWRRRADAKASSANSAPDTADLRDRIAVEARGFITAGARPGNVVEHDVPHAAGRAASRSETPPATAPASTSCKRSAWRHAAAAQQCVTASRNDPSASHALRALYRSDRWRPRRRRLGMRKEKPPGRGPSGWRYNREETPDRAGARSRNLATQQTYFAAQHLAR
jgi:hypothetical protein